MTHLTQKIVLGLSLLVVSPVFSNSINSEASEKTTPSAPAISPSDKINDEVNKILKYSEKLKTAKPSRREILEAKIGDCQQTIRELSKSIAENTASSNRIINKYDFKVEENSLDLTRFSVKRLGSESNFELSIKADKTGEAQIDIISPGGELLESFTETDFDGSLSKTINLSAEKGQVYFVHMRIGNEETTKKVRFS